MVKCLIGMVHAMNETKSGPLSPKKPVKEKIVGIYDDFFKVRNTYFTQIRFAYDHLIFL